MLVPHPCETSENSRESISKRHASILEPVLQMHQQIGPTVHPLHVPPFLAHIGPLSEHCQRQNPHDKQTELVSFHSGAVDNQKPITAIWKRLNHRSLPVPRPVRLLSRLLRSVRRAATRLPLRPQGPGSNDQNLLERVYNVSTCIPFCQAGFKILRRCPGKGSQHFGVAFIVVGAVAAAYHSSWGGLRHWTRKADYWTIAVSSCLLKDAVCQQQSPWLRCAAFIAIPFKPSAVSMLNFVAVEVKYMQLAACDPSRVAAWVVHSLLSISALSCFALEDIPVVAQRAPYIHAAWHALSAGSFMTLTNCLSALDP